MSGHRTSLRTSDCSQRQNNARRAARAPRAAPQRPARGASSTVSPGQPQEGSPGPSLLPAPYLSAAGSCTGCSCLRHSAALLRLHGAQHQAAAPSCLPRALSSSSCPREGGDGRVHARMERVRCWGTGRVMGTNLLPQEDLKPCPERQPPRCPSTPCGCCRCSCSWGSAASGPGCCPQVSVGGHGWAQRGTAEHRWMREAVEQCCRRMCGHGHRDHCDHGWECGIPPVLSPLIFACCRNYLQTPRSTLGELSGVSGALTPRVPLWG